MSGVWFRFKFHSVTCYTNSVASLIHVNTTKLRNITCTLVAMGVILQSLECICLNNCALESQKQVCGTLNYFRLENSK